MTARRSVTAIAFLILLLECSACSIFEPDTAERTLPGAVANLELVSLQSLKNSTPAPVSYNIEAYVVSINVCADGALCIVPDGIIVAERRDLDLPEEGLRLTVMQPRQFHEQGRYLLSVHRARNEHGKARPRHEVAWL